MAVGSASAILLTALITACGGGGGGSTTPPVVTANEVATAAITAKTPAEGAHALDLADKYTNLFPATNTDPGGLDSGFKAVMGNLLALYNQNGLPETFGQAIDDLKTLSTTSDTRDQIIAQLNAQMTSVGNAPVTAIDRVLVLLGKRSSSVVAPKPITADEQISPYSIFLVATWLHAHAPYKDGYDSSVTGAAAALAAATPKATHAAAPPKTRDDQACIDACNAAYNSAVQACDTAKTNAEAAAQAENAQNLQRIQDQYDATMAPLMTQEMNLQRLMGTYPNAPQYNSWAQGLQQIARQEQQALQTMQTAKANAAAFLQAKLKQINDAHASCTKSASDALSSCIAGCHDQGGD